MSSFNRSPTKVFTSDRKSGFFFVLPTCAKVLLIGIGLQVLYATINTGPERENFLIFKKEHNYVHSQTAFLIEKI